MVPNVDIIMESYHPGFMEKLGLVPEIIHSINPNVLYVRLSPYGKAPSKYTLQNGNDINFLAFSGLLNKFKRIGKGSAPVPPANLLGDFASGSLYCFNLILQALVLNKQYTVIDFSVSHALLYLSQPLLLEGKSDVEMRRKPGDSSISNFTRPH
jgi:alpha-methylacyl-CoA racemase